MKESAAQQAYSHYTQQGVGSQTLLSRAEFDEFWAALDGSEQDYWLEQFRRGPIGLSKELLAGFSSGDEEPLDSDLLKRIGERLRSLGAITSPRS